MTLCLHALVPQSSAQVSVARLKYSGGGDWYANPTSLKNWRLAVKRDLGCKFDIKPPVGLSGSELWDVDLLYATGHGNISFSKTEADTLRRYLLSGGFLWVDDNYGMDRFFRMNILKVFPDKQLRLIDDSHPVYKGFHSLMGLPKIHEHDGMQAEGFGLFHEGRMILFYSYSSDIGDGLEDSNVHKVPSNLRRLAAKMAVNITYYVLNY
tara:strand:+ start:1346 stop:1972 length:627 start_codon:yes stop_codon:yes gene_type:complete